MALKGDLIFSPITDIELSDRLGIDELEMEIAGKSTVTYTPTVTSGVELGKIKVDGTTKKIFAPESVEDVSVTQTVASGTKLATVTVDGTDTDIYAPTIPAEKHLEWVTVATGTEGTTNANQFAELYTVFSTLSSKEKVLTRLILGNLIFNLEHIIGIYCHSRNTPNSLLSYHARIDAGYETYINGIIKADSITFTEKINETAEGLWQLQVLRLVDNT